MYRRDFKLFYILGDFSIDAGTGVIRTVNKLERDLGYQYNLTIKATDHGSPALSATVSYRISLELIELSSMDKVSLV